MLPDFRIQNFRCFRDLHLKGLGRVNLLVGKNNTGKSTVLEALSLWARAGAPDELMRILNAREPVEDQRRGWYTRIEATFHQSGQPSAPVVPSGQLGPAAGDERVTFYIPAIGEFGSPSVPGLLEAVTKLSEPPKYKAALAGKKFQRPLTPEEMVRWDPTWPAICECTHIPAAGIGDDRAEQLWTTIAGFPEEEQLVAALRVVEPSVERVYRVRAGSGQGTFRLRRTGRAVPEAIQRFGDGMRRVLGFALTALTARGGLLLIDEFENGVHYEVQEPLWRWLIEVATRLDVQVFATTHSLDCVRGFTAAVVDHPEAGALYRLDRRGDRILAFTLDEADLSTSMDHQMDVR